VSVESPIGRLFTGDETILCVKVILWICLV